MAISGKYGKIDIHLVSTRSKIFGHSLNAVFELVDLDCQAAALPAFHVLLIGVGKLPYTHINIGRVPVGVLVSKLFQF